MAYLVYLERLSPNIKRKLSIKREEWQACVAEVAGIKWANDEQELDFYNEQAAEWQPLFCIDSDGSAYAKAINLLEDQASSGFLKAKQVAKHLNAYLRAEGNDFFWIPGWDAYFSGSDEFEVVTANELLAYRQRYGQNTADLVAHMAGIQTELPSEPPTDPQNHVLKQTIGHTWHRYWWVLLLAGSILVKLLLQLK